MDMKDEEWSTIVKREEQNELNFSVYTAWQADQKQGLDKLNYESELLPKLLLQNYKTYTNRGYSDLIHYKCSGQNFNEPSYKSIAPKVLLT